MSDLRYATLRHKHNEIAWAIHYEHLQNSGAFERLGCKESLKSVLFKNRVGIDEKVSACHGDINF